MMKKLIALSSLGAMFAVAAAGQHFRTCTITQFKWDDSTDKKIVCVEHYDDKGKVVWKEYVNSQSVIDASEDGDDKGTKVYYNYKDSLLLNEYRFRTPEYEDTALTSNMYNAKGQLILQVIRRHEKFTAANPAGGSEPIVRWKWLTDSIQYQYNDKGQMTTQSGGEKWHKMVYLKTGNGNRDTSFSSPADLKARNFFVTSSSYNKDKQLLKKVKDHYVNGKKHFNNTIEYTYADGKLVKVHSTATSYSKNKAEDAKYENMRFDKKFFYYKDGKLERVETWDPEGFRLLATIYEYK